MPRQGTGVYPSEWPAFARRLKESADWVCIRCNHPHDPKGGYCLTVHHWLMDKSEPFEHWWAFLVLCQRCHLHIQGKVYPYRPWVFEHSEWFKPYAAGFYAWKYLGVHLSREGVEARLDELLELESRAVIGSPPIVVTRKGD